MENEAQGGYILLFYFCMLKELRENDLMGDLCFSKPIMPERIKIKGFALLTNTRAINGNGLFASFFMPGCNKQ
jgi:hypothetical protein